jgi:hypothetical protein
MVNRMSGKILHDDYLALLEAAHAGWFFHRLPIANQATNCPLKTVRLLKS